MALVTAVIVSGIIHLVLHWKIYRRNSEFNFAFRPLFSVYLGRKTLRKSRFQSGLEGEIECERVRKHGLNESLGSSTIFGKIFLEKAKVLALSITNCLPDTGDFNYPRRVISVGAVGISFLDELEFEEEFYT